MDLPDIFQKQDSEAVGPALVDVLKPLAHRCKLAIIKLLYRYYFGECSSLLSLMLCLLNMLITALPMLVIVL